MTLDLGRASADNLALHFSWVQARAEGMRARVTEILTTSDSGLDRDTFNAVCRARLTGSTQRTALRDAISWFEGRAFSWWLAPWDSPRDLPELLGDMGLEPAEEEQAMTCDLATLPERLPWPEDLELRRVRSPDELRTFAGLLAALSDPPDVLVPRFYTRAAPHLLEAVCPLRLYLGLRAGEAVATSEMTVGGGVAGLYNISTVPDQRRRGIGSAMTLLPLQRAAKEGLRFGVLQAAPGALGVYRRVGFEAVGRIVEFKPPARVGSSGSPRPP